MRSPLATYAFLSAKLKTRVSTMLGPEKIEDLIRAKSLSEAFLVLRGSRFERLEAIYAETADLRAVEAELFAGEARTYSELLRYAKPPLSDFLVALSLRFEVDRLKSLLRLWFDAHHRAGDILGKAAYLGRSTVVQPFDADAILGAADPEGLRAALAGTAYAGLAAEGMTEALRRGSLLSLELALDRLYFDAAFSAADRLPAAERKTARRVLELDADAQNADRLFRCAAYHRLGAREIADYLLPYGAGSAARKLASAAGAGGAGAGGTGAEGREGDAAIKAAQRAIGSALGDAGGFLEASGESRSRGLLMHRMLKLAKAEEARHLIGGNPFSVGIVLAYGALRREECAAVLAILNAKAYGLDERRIRDAL